MRVGETHQSTVEKSRVEFEATSVEKSLVPMDDEGTYSGGNKMVRTLELPKVS
ncbi:MAG: hypothetical protein ABJ059_00835 [Hyphomicrobiales bacterium]